jgi:hypothetical protein
MLRRTRTELIDNRTLARDLRADGLEIQRNEEMWRATNGARLRFAYLERDADAELYQGHSYTRLYVEEIRTFPNPAPIFKLMATLRSSAGVPVRFRATGNPGGPGHQWVKAHYVDPAPFGTRSFAMIKRTWSGYGRLLSPCRRPAAWATSGIRRRMRLLEIVPDARH